MILNISCLPSTSGADSRLQTDATKARYRPQRAGDDKRRPISLEVSMLFANKNPAVTEGL
jgi:hypothetical protein